MIHLSIGAIVGVVMGLTGSGGALISIPLFMQFLGMPLKHASVLSLFVVMLGAFSNFFNFKKFANYKLAAIFILVSALGSYLSLPYKKLISDKYIGLILALISFFALYNIWKPIKTVPTQFKPPGIFVSILIGLFLGLLTTFSGIGGGILIIPILLSFYHFSQDQALGTSLLTVGLSSTASFLLQIYQGSDLKPNLDLIYLGVGTFSASYLLKWLSQKWSPSFLSKTRKFTFTLIVIFSLFKIFNA